MLYATRRHQHGVDIETLRQELGHSDITTTQIYPRSANTKSDRHRARVNEADTFSIAATCKPFLHHAVTRISILTGIFKGLNILYSKKLADRWIQLPNENPMIEGETPLTYMIKGGLPAMLRVRQLLDSRRGGR